MRKDIQALRALAVMGVFVYHMRPGYLPGGFAGVDVFFVLSGFLISSHLLVELRDRGSIELAKFWSRRAKRLLPASLTVLGLTGIFVWLLAPQALQERFFRDIGAASVYVANWVFAFDSVDYLAADNSPSVVQHFWSLGVEEQLYLVWPVLLILSYRLLKPRLASPVLSVGLVLSAIAVASLIYSAWTVFDNNPIGYFSTFSRAFEFAAGGLLALAVTFRDFKIANAAVATVMSWTGWLGLAVFFFLFEAQLGFPGLWALVPTVLTLLIIASGDPGSRLSAQKILHLKPIQFLGDASYSIYLWHWPLLVFAGFYFSALSWQQLAAIFALTLVLSWLSMRFIENPFRFGTLKSRLSPKTTFAGVGATMLVLVASTQAASAAVSQRIELERANSQALEQELNSRISEEPEDPLTSEKVWDEISCMGPASLVEAECGGFTWDEAIPAVGVGEETAHDVEPIERFGSEKGCLAWGDDYSLIRCTFGVKGEKKIALIGDSHAYHWLPAFARLAELEGFELHLLARAGCPANEVPRAANGDHVRGCFEWIDEMTVWLSSQSDFETLVIANFSGSKFEAAGDIWEPQLEAQKGYIEAWAAMSSGSAEIVVLRDTPFIGQETWDCVVKRAPDINECSVSREEVLRVVDNSAEAAATEGFRVLDMTDYFCTELECPMAVGGVRVYRDSNHMSGTYNLLLTPYLREELMGQR